ncbi:MAG: ROK family transcriptional regulator [Treponema sp.]|jgi:predicted NBD/HSP70 family sugar kinase|nr:ROK family transcriptional regulator [Treponema sp.]
MNRKEYTDTSKQIIEIVYTRRQITRKDLAEATGLSSLTVVKNIAALIGDGVIEETETLNTIKGRKPLFLSPNPDYGYVIGIDVGSYSIKMGIVDFSGRIIEKKEVIDEFNSGFPSSILDFSELRSHIAALADKYGAEKLLGIGVGITGLVNNNTQTIVFCPNIRGYNNLAISSALQEQFKVPVLVDTSARCMALGEMFFGGGERRRQPPDDASGELSFVSVGHSIAVGTIIGGKIFRGVNGFAGELGHVKAVMGEQKVCTCGSYNCIEGYVTLPEIKNALVGKLNEFRGYSLLKEKIENSGDISYEDMANAVSMGDKVAVECFGETIEKLSIVLADYVNLFNPASLVLGGGFFDMFPFVLPELERELQKQCLTPSLWGIKLGISELSVDGAIKGSAMQIIQTMWE